MPNNELRSWRALVPVLGTAMTIRLAVLLIGLFATITIGPEQKPPAAAEERIPSAGTLAELPNRWDARWYVGIAAGGYRYRGTAEVHSDRVAFFPAYPLALRALARVFFVPRISAAWAWVGVALSLCAFLGASSYVYLLARDLGDGTGTAAAALVAAYPFALFFGAVYTESFFLLGAAATFWYFGRGAFAPAAMWGMFTGLVRPNAVMLVLPLFVMSFQPNFPHRSARRLGLSAAILAPVLGNALYSAYLWWLTGDPLGWASAQESWGRHYLGITGAATDVASSIVALGLRGFVAMRPYDAINAAAGIFTLALVIPVQRKLGWAYATFMVVNLIPALVVGGLPSLGRYTSVLFPIHIWLAAVVPSRFRYALLAPMAILQGLLATLHYTSRPLY